MSSGFQGVTAETCRWKGLENAGHVSRKSAPDVQGHLPISDFISRSGTLLLATLPARGVAVFVLHVGSGVCAPRRGQEEVEERLLQAVLGQFPRRLVPPT